MVNGDAAQFSIYALARIEDGVDDACFFFWVVVVGGGGGEGQFRFFILPLAVTNPKVTSLMYKVSILYNCFNIRINLCFYNFGENCRRE